MSDINLLVRKLRVGDVIKSPWICSHEVVISISKTDKEYSYETQYIEGSERKSAVSLNNACLYNMQYEVLYNMFDVQAQRGATNLCL